MGWERMGWWLQLFDLIIWVGIFSKCSGEIKCAQTNTVNKREASSFVRYVKPIPIGNPSNRDGGVDYSHHISLPPLGLESRRRP